MTLADAEAWFRRTRPQYERLTDSIAILIRRLLDANGVDPSLYSLEARSKSLNSFLKKVEGRGYANPAAQCTDISAARVVTRSQLDARRIESILRTDLTVDEALSQDPQLKLGSDRMGYRAIQFVCRLDANIRSNEDIAPLYGLAFEVQIRSLLMHAWAEASHRYYKMASVFPDGIRDLNKISASLELLDDALDRAVTQLDGTAAERFAQTIAGDLSAELDAETTRACLKLKLGETPQYARSADEEVDYETIADECRKFGLRTVADLSGCFTQDFFRWLLEEGGRISLVGLVRLALALSDWPKFLRSHGGMLLLDDTAYSLLRRKYSSKEIRLTIAVSGGAIRNSVTQKMDRDECSGD